jgi:fused-like protein
VKDPVKYPEKISPQFKSFLRGLLNKTPSQRLDWPKLAEHPFVKETEEEKLQKLQLQEKNIGRMRLLKFEEFVKSITTQKPLSRLSNNNGSQEKSDTPTDSGTDNSSSASDVGYNISVQNILSTLAGSDVSLLLKDVEALKSLIKILDEETLGHIYNRAEKKQGGATVVKDIVERTTSLILSLLTSPCADNVIATVQQILYKEEVVKHCIKCLKYIPKDSFLIPVDILSRLVLGSGHFARQYVKYDGLDPSIIGNLLDPSNNSKLIINALLIVSQLARISKDHYKPIHQANIYKNIKALLKHKDPEIRSKTCNLIGNMCRHSAYFYEALEKYELLPELIDRCQDSDQNTRKFACFAIGNASFHNASLYENMKSCIPLLTNLLNDNEEKTRANAAGALGNLVRNSGLLIEELIKKDALGALMSTLQEDSGGSARKIALFSLGNFCVYEECRAILAAKGFEDLVKQFFVKYSNDAVMVKYLTRIKKFFSNK